MAASHFEFNLVDPSEDVRRYLCTWASNSCHAYLIQPGLRIDRPTWTLGGELLVPRQQKKLLLLLHMNFSNHNIAWPAPPFAREVLAMLTPEAYATRFEPTTTLQAFAATQDSAAVDPLPPLTWDPYDIVDDLNRAEADAKKRNDQIAIGRDMLGLLMEVAMEDGLDIHLRKSTRKSTSDLYVMHYELMVNGALVPDVTSSKIGKSIDTEKRRRGLQQSHNFYMRVDAIFPGCGKYETYVQARLAKFKSARGTGREWFTLSGSEAVRRVKKCLFMKRWGKKLWRGATCNKARA